MRTILKPQIWPPWSITEKFLSRPMMMCGIVCVIIFCVCVVVAAAVGVAVTVL